MVLRVAAVLGLPALLEQLGYQTCPASLMTGTKAAAGFRHGNIRGTESDHASGGSVWNFSRPW